MTSYRYYPHVDPPAPFVHLRLRNPVTGAEARDVPAQVDTGAYRTVLTLAAVEALDLVPLGPVTVGGLGGAPQQVPAFAVELGVGPLPPRLLKVLAHPGEPWVLVGRDVLNGHRLLLDGPRQMLEVG